MRDLLLAGLLALAAFTACAGGERGAASVAAAFFAAPAPVPLPLQPAGTWTAADARARELPAFREGLERPAALDGGAASAPALVDAWVRALEARDSSAFAPMLLSRAEFAWLYYPTHPLARPPYDLSPDEMWFQQSGNSAKGLREVLEKRGGRSLGFLGFRCDPPISYGENRFHGNCIVRRLENGTVREERLFGSILERGNRWKFVSYSARI